MRVLTKCLAILAILAAVPAFAQTEPPARVGRVSLIEGTLAFYGPGDSEWSAAKVNLPVATGGWFATDAQSLGQIGVGPDLLNLAHDTQLNVADLRENIMQIALTQGRVNLHLRRLLWRRNETAEIDIPRGGVWLLQPGRYDIDSGAADQPARITVFEGSARFVGGGIDQTVKAGEQLIVSGGDPLVADVQPAAPDEFDAWCEAHDYRENRVAASRHVSPGMTGYEQLDDYGQWNTVPSYGAVWFPQSTPADWAPYREGHWVWLEPWGWNWVDDEPWGFAPFHYGRWARIDDRWGWVPGEFAAEPVYAPALVAFIPPPAIEADIAFGADAGPPVGWFPLAPGELYWPAYSRDPTYIRNVNITNVNITNITQVTNVLRTQPAVAGPPPAVVSQRFANRGAATVVPAQVFANSAPVAPATVRVPATVLQKAAVAAAPPPAVAHPAGTAIAPPHGQTAGTPTVSTPPSAQTTTTAARFATPQHPPARPQFSQLAAAPRVGRPAATARAAPAAAAPPTTAAAPAAHPPQVPAAPPPAVATGPGAPNFSRLAPTGNTPRGPSPGGHPTAPTVSAAPPAGPHTAQPGGPPATTAAKPPQGAPPVQAGGPTPRPAHPPSPPDFAHLPAWHPGPNAPPQPGQRPTSQPASGPTPPHQPAQAAPLPAVPNAQPPAATAHAGAPSTVRPGQNPQMRQPVAAQPQQRAAAQAQQRAAAQAAAQAQQRAAAQAAAQAQQRAAAQAAAQAQQRAAAQAAAQAQQRAAAQAAAQAQQRAAAAQAAAQAQQRAAAAQAAAQAQQRAAAQAAAQAQQRAAAAQAQQRAAAQAAAARQHQAQACGHPGGPPCPK